jgi:hypothetical protein
MQMPLAIMLMHMKMNFFAMQPVDQPGAKRNHQRRSGLVPAALHFWLINDCPTTAIGCKKPAALAHDRRSSKMCFA